MSSRGVNKVILIGRLAQDPDMRYMQNGNAVVNFTVATTDTWKEKNSGEQKERTEWNRVCAFRQLAEIIGKYLKKGSHVYIEGKLQTRKWQDKDGNDRYTTEIIANEMQMLGDRPQQESRQHQHTAPGYGQAQQKKTGRFAQQQGQQQGAEDPGYDSDIPF